MSKISRTFAENYKCKVATFKTKQSSTDVKRWRPPGCHECGTGAHRRRSRGSCCNGTCLLQQTHEDGGVARASDPEMMLKIKDAVTIPVMAKARLDTLWRHKY